MVDFLMFLDVPDVDDAMMWKTRLRQRSVCINRLINSIKCVHYVGACALRYMYHVVVSIEG